VVTKKGEDARLYLPSIIGDDKSTLILGVTDFTQTDEKLGYMIVYPGTYEKIGEKYFFKQFSPKQAEMFKFSFVFIGTNPNLFSHLYISTMSGKYTGKDIMLDRGFENAISNEMKLILLNHIKRVNDV